MSWSYEKVGRASKLATVVKEQVEKVGGCPVGSAEESAKNQIGAVLETLCGSFAEDRVVQIKASGSAWTQPNGKALSQQMTISFSTIGDFVE